MSMKILGVRPTVKDAAETYLDNLITDFVGSGTHLLFCLPFEDLDKKCEFAEKHFSYEYDLLIAVRPSIHNEPKEICVKKAVDDFRNICQQIEKQIKAKNN